MWGECCFGEGGDCSERTTGEMSCGCEGGECGLRSLFGSIGCSVMTFREVDGGQSRACSEGEHCEASSGLAMRSPPKDWERLKSPLMVGCSTAQLSRQETDN